MSKIPESVARFLSGRRFVVAGVSRSPQQPANAVMRKLRSCGFEVVPVNPQAKELEGVVCYPDLASVPGPIDGVIIATLLTSRRRWSGRRMAGASNRCGFTVRSAQAVCHRRP
jgi:hypothetical protein